MKRTLPILLLCVAMSAAAKKPAPPPPPPEDPVEEEEAPLPDVQDDLDDPDEDVVPQRRADDAKSTPTASKKNKNKDPNELTEDEKAMAGVGSLCCCLVFVIGLVVLIVWLVKRGSGTRKTAPVAGPAPSPAPGAAGEMQLSIFALALEPQAREVVEQQLAQLGISNVPNSPEGRGQLVREAARALLTVTPSWRQFGYGEKPGMGALAAAESSYRTASEDFRGRALSVGATSPDAGLVVVTLLICCRRSLLGVSRLDDPTQVRNVLEDRMRVVDADLLGTELLWAPAAQGGRVSEAEIGLRFPEMLPLQRTAI